MRAHPSLASALTIAAATAVFNVANCAFFETTTLLLLARSMGRLSLPGENRS